MHSSKLYTFKWLLFFPILSCKKNIGPLELNFISKEIIKKKVANQLLKK